MTSQEQGGLPSDDLLDLFTDKEGVASAAPDAATDPLERLSGMPPVQRLPPLERQLQSALRECFSPVAQHVSAGFQLHSCTPLDAHLSSEDDTTRPGLDVYHPEPIPPKAPPVASLLPTFEERELAPASPLLLALAVREEVSARCGADLLLLRANWQLQDSEPPVWEAAMLRCPPKGDLRCSLFYRDGHLAILQVDESSGSTLSLLEHSTLPFVPLPPSQTAAGGAVTADGSLLTLAAKLVAEGEMRVLTLEPERSRTFPNMTALELAVSQRRGTASIVSKARRLWLLDLEEDQDEEDEDEQQGEDDDAAADADMSETGM